MPIYEFVCEECGETFEELVVNQNKIYTISCPYCQSDLIRKLFSPFVSRVSSGGQSPGSSLQSASCNTTST